MDDKGNLTISKKFIDSPYFSELVRNIASQEIERYSIAIAYTYFDYQCTVLTACLVADMPTDAPPPPR